MAERFDLDQAAEQARRHVDYAWDPRREAALRQAMHVRVARRRLHLAGFTAAGVVAAVAAAALLHQRRPVRPAVDTTGRSIDRVAARGTRPPRLGPGQPEGAGTGGSRKLLAYAPAAFIGPAGLEALCARLDQVEAAPIDGLVLTPNLPKLWTAPLADADLERLGHALRCLGGGRLHDNFLALQVSVSDWTDEAKLANAVRNARALATFVRDLPVAGIFLDTQTYVTTEGRFALPAGRAFDEAARLLHRRGHDLMAALQQGGRPLAVLLTLGYAEAFRRTCIEGKPLSETSVALLPAFVDGLQDAADARGPSRPYVADVFLSSYTTETPAAFPALRELIHGRFDDALDHWTPGTTTYTFPVKADPWSGAYVWPERPVSRCTAADRARLGRGIDAGFGIMLDYEHDIRGGFALQAAEFSRNHLTPAQLTEVLGAALAASDRYVWLFGSTVSLWPADGAAVIPQEYVEAIRAARR
jgi:hypothetical protein